MKILLFLSEAAGGRFDHLENIIGDIVPTGCLQICHNIIDLSQRLRDPCEKYDIAILLATINPVLEEFISIKSLLEDLRIILIIPDRKKETISRGHLLMPRYLTFADSDFKNVAAVLEKMIEFIKKQIFSERR